MADFYGEALARLHHERFGAVARAAAHTLLERLRAAGITAGTVADLACGSGILSRAVIDAGFSAWGVDLSEEMVALARREAPAGTFVCQSLWGASLPTVVGVAAVGEAFSYAADPTAGLEALAARLRTIHDALAPGGMLLFDVAGPGRSGPTGLRSAFSSHGELAVGLEERETGRRLTRTISLFVPDGDRHRRIVETHALCLYLPEEIEGLQAAAGFTWERLDRYADLALAPGWHAWVATRPRAIG